VNPYFTNEKSSDQDVPWLAPGPKGGRKNCGFRESLKVEWDAALGVAFEQGDCGYPDDTERKENKILFPCM
jgi:hypothetical protein